MPCSQPHHGYSDGARTGSEDRLTLAISGRSFNDLQQNMSELQANKEKVLGLIADILSSGASNDDKERKLGDIISDLETVRRCLAEQKAAQFKVLLHSTQNNEETF